MRRLSLSLVFALALASLILAPVFAGNPHFIYANAAGPDANGDLIVNFKIAGLGSTIETTISTQGNATAVYACQNNGGNFPNDPKKTEVSGPVSASGQFTSGKNGQITGSLTLSPPSTDLSCPGKQVVVLVSVVYSNLSVHEDAAGTQQILGTFSRVFFDI